MAAHIQSDQSQEMTPLTAEGDPGSQNLSPDMVTSPVVPQSSAPEPAPKACRVRTKFDAMALSRLEVEFGMDQYPTAARRNVLAAELAIPQKAIYNWFHNKRSRLRRQNRPASTALHPTGMYRQMSNSSDSSVSSVYLSSPGSFFSPQGTPPPFSPLVTPILVSPAVAPPPAKRFRSWTVEAVPSPEGVSFGPDGDYHSRHSSLDLSTFTDSLSPWNPSTPTSPESPLPLGSSVPSGELSLDDIWSRLTSPSGQMDVSSLINFLEVHYPESVPDEAQQEETHTPGDLPGEDVYYPESVPDEAQQEETGTPGDLPGEDVFHHPDSPATPLSPATPGEVFNPTVGIPHQIGFGDLNNNDQSYQPGLAPRDRLAAVSTVQQAGLVTLSRPRLDAASQAPTPVPVPSGRRLFPPTPQTSSADYTQGDFELPLLQGRLHGSSDLQSPEFQPIPGFNTPASSFSPQTPTWLYTNSPFQQVPGGWIPSPSTPGQQVPRGWTPSPSTPGQQVPRGWTPSPSTPGHQVPRGWTPSPTTPDNVQAILASQWHPHMLTPVPSPWATPSASYYFQFPNVSPGVYNVAPGFSPYSPYRDLDSDSPC